MAVQVLGIETSTGVVSGLSPGVAQSATGLTAVEVEVDFGSLPVEEGTFTIVDAGCSATSKVMVAQSGNTATGRFAGDALWDSIAYAALPGTGQFTLHASPSGPVDGKRKILYTIT